MVESLGSGNGSSPTSGFDIPAPDFVAQGKAQGQGLQAAGLFDDGWRKWVLSHVTGPGAILSGISSILDEFISLYVGFVGQLQGADTPGLFTLISTVLSDLLATEVSADAVNAAWKKGGSRAAYKKVGAGLWNALLGELGNPAALTPESGLAAAQGWLGYLLGFTVREGNVALISSIIPEELRFLEGINEYAEAMRSALGFGRMSRQVLHPLIQTLITDPLQWYVNRQYSPKLLGESLATKAYNRGLITADAWTQEMQYAGYSDARAAIIREDGLVSLTANDAFALYKRGHYTFQQLTATLNDTAFDPQRQADWLQARVLAEVDPWQSVLITDWKTQVLGGYISLIQFEGYVGSLGLLPDVANALKQSVGQLLDLPRRKLTLAEVQSAFVEGLIDSTDVSAYLKREGYSDDDQLTLWYQTLLKLGTQEAKMAVAQYKYDKAVAKAEKAGEPIPPKPPILAVGPT